MGTRRGRPVTRSTRFRVTDLATDHGHWMPSDVTHPEQAMWEHRASPEWGGEGMRVEKFWGRWRGRRFETMGRLMVWWYGERGDEVEESEVEGTQARKRAGR